MAFKKQREALAKRRADQEQNAHNGANETGSSRPLVGCLGEAKWKLQNHL